MKRVLPFIFLMFVACQTNEADAPELATDDAQQIGATSVLMGAEIREIGPVRPVNFGFFWDTQPDVSIMNAGNRMTVGSTSAPRKFSIHLDNLQRNTKYYYRGFAANEDYSKVYYSGVVSFTTLP